MLKLIALLICLIASPCLAKEIKVHDSETPTMKALKDKDPKVGDVIEVKDKKGLVWDDITEKDAEGKDVKVSVIKGTTQHHLVPGSPYWRTVIDLEGKRYKGKSIMDGGYTFTIEEVE